MQAKNPFTSKTNLLQILAAVVTYLPTIQEALPESVRYYVPGVVYFGTMILRHFTFRPVSFKAPIRAD